MRWNVLIMPKGVRGFQKGNKVSPGRPPGGQSFVDRASYLLDTLSVDEILKRVQYLQLPKDKKLHTAEIKALHKKTLATPARDLVIMMRIAEAFTREGGDGLDRLIDRIIGKPKQPLEHKVNGTVGFKSVSAIDEFLAEEGARAEAASAAAAVPH